MHRFPLAPRFQKLSNKMKALERHIQLIINVPAVICLFIYAGSCFLLGTKKKRSTSLTHECGFYFMNIKIHLQPEYWDEQFTVTNLLTRIDSYL